MSLKLLILSLSFFVCLHAEAQEQLLGVRGGLTSSGILIYKMEGWGTAHRKLKSEPIINTTFAIDYSSILIGKFYLRTGLELTTKGAVLYTDSIRNIYNNWYEGRYEYYTVGNLRLSYLTIPLMLSRHVMIDSRRKHILTLSAGISTSFLVRAYSHWSSTYSYTPGGSLEPDTYGQIKGKGQVDGFRRWDYSTQVGIGYMYRIGNNLFAGIEGRYTENYGDINKTFQSSEVLKNADNYSVTLSLMVNAGFFKKEERKK